MSLELTYDNLTLHVFQRDERAVQSNQTITQMWILGSGPVAIAANVDSSAILEEHVALLAETEDWQVVSYWDVSLQSNMN